VPLEPVDTLGEVRAAFAVLILPDEDDLLHLANLGCERGETRRDAEIAPNAERHRHPRPPGFALFEAMIEIGSRRLSKPQLAQLLRALAGV
jgi:hypothetical protein